MYAIRSYYEEDGDVTAGNGVTAYDGYENDDEADDDQHRVRNNFV